jgi:hypothetical protein
MIRNYPWRGKISRKTHYSVCMHAILNESYLIEERLKRFFNIMKECAEATGEQFRDDSASAILKSYHRTLVSFLKARGIHTHQSDFEPQELDRIGLIELLTQAGGMKEFKFALPIAHREFKKIWQKNIDGAQAAIELHMVAAFECTKKIWSKLGP